MDVSRLLVTTGGAGECVTRADTPQPPAAAVLAGVGRIDFGYHHAEYCCLVLGCRSDQGTLPLRQPAAGRFAFDLALPWRRHVELLEDQHRVVWGEGYQVLGRGLGKATGAIGALAAKPFEHPSNTMGIVVLCLTGRMFLLQALARLIVALVGDLCRLAADKECLALWINRHQR